MPRIDIDGGTDSPVIALPFPTTAASVLVLGRQCALMGFAVIETTGAAAAQIDLLDGQDVGGQLLTPIALTQGASAVQTFSAWGLAANSGLFVKVNAGSVRGVLFVAVPPL